MDFSVDPWSNFTANGISVTFDGESVLDAFDTSQIQEFIERRGDTQCFIADADSDDLANELISRGELENYIDFDEFMNNHSEEFLSSMSDEELIEECKVRGINDDDNVFEIDRNIYDAVLTFVQLIAQHRDYKFVIKR